MAVLLDPNLEIVVGMTYLEPFRRCIIYGITRVNFVVVAHFSRQRIQLAILSKVKRAEPSFGGIGV